MKKAVSVILLMVLLMTGCQLVDMIPTEGIWYCEELQIQVCFYKNEEDCGSDPCANSYIIEDGEKNLCYWHNSRGNDLLIIARQKDGDMGFKARNAVLYGNCIRYDEHEMVIEDSKKNETFIFIRVG